MGGLETRPFRDVAVDDDCMVRAEGPRLKPVLGWVRFRGLKAPAPSEKATVAAREKGKSSGNGNGKNSS
jgi:hypothetical protein